MQISIQSQPCSRCSTNVHQMYRLPTQLKHFTFLGELSTNVDPSWTCETFTRQEVWKPRFPLSKGGGCSNVSPEDCLKPSSFMSLPPDQEEFVFRRPHRLGELHNVIKQDFSRNMSVHKIWWQIEASVVWQGQVIWFLANLIAKHHASHLKLSSYLGIATLTKPSVLPGPLPF